MNESTTIECINNESYRMTFGWHIRLRSFITLQSNDFFRRWFIIYPHLLHLALNSLRIRGCFSEVGSTSGRTCSRTTGDTWRWCQTVKHFWEAVRFFWEAAKFLRTAAKFSPLPWNIFWVAGVASGATIGATIGATTGATNLKKTSLDSQGVKCQV